MCKKGCCCMAASLFVFVYAVGFEKDSVFSLRESERQCGTKGASRFFPFHPVSKKKAAA